MRNEASFVFAMTVLFVLSLPPAFAATERQNCELAQEYLQESGVARDATEDFFGRIKIKSPRSSFPPEMDKVTWWGEFKPFEFWEGPRFEAAWINPQGEEGERQSFRGGRCRLAKTTLPAEGLPQRRLESGIWRVVVTCGDVTIDNRPFAVVGSPPSKDGGRDPGIMIWADEVD